MAPSQIVTSIGLALDLTGAILVAKDYWNPSVTSKYETEKRMFDTSAQEKRNQEQINNYPYAKYGLLLLISGFIVQLIAQMM